MAEHQVSIPIIDSHIHLYPEEELESLSWWTPDSPLTGRHSLEEYAQAHRSPPNLRGFIFVETDRKNQDGADWKCPLQEISWLKRIALGTPKPGQGHAAADAKLCLGIVCWAPLPSGPSKVEEYLKAAEEEAGQAWPKVKGFRYLLQFQPNGTALKDEFVDSLKLLGRKGYVFEIAVDQHRRGRIQLEEAVELVDRAHEGVPEQEKVVFVIDHLCKPDLGVINPADPSFVAWRTAIFTLSKCRQTYIKLSGALSEMPEALAQRSPEEIFMAIYPWLAVVLAAFGPSRIMFGSDWPVATVAAGDEAWTKWEKVVARMCFMASLSMEDQFMLWSGTAAKAYGINIEPA